MAFPSILYWIKSQIMKNTLLLLITICIHFSISSQTLPSDRSVNWSLAGLDASFSEPANEIDFKNLGAHTDGKLPNDSLLNAVLESIGTSGAKIIFPIGTYLFHNAITLKNDVFILGESADSTIFIFDLETEDHNIKITGSESGISSKLTSDVLRGSAEITLESASEFNQGDIIRIIDNDTEKITSSWAKKSTGQIIKIISVQGNVVTLGNPIHRDYSVSNDAMIIKLNVVSNCAIENIQITNKSQITASYANIFMNYAHNIRMKCIKSIDCNFAHVDIRNSFKVDIEGSYFTKAFDYGDGGRAYGVMIQQNSSHCLVMNNIFKKLRHAMIFQSGANGNVFAYNYSLEPYWTDVSLPSDAAGDIVLHGNYPYANLFEGNIGQNIVIDDSHGENGPYNTFFRNRAEYYGIVMNADPASDRQNFLGNEITNKTFLFGNYMLFGDDHFTFGNNHKGSIKPNGTNDLPEASLFLSEMPGYYQKFSSWPPIGVPNSNNQYQNEARHRYSLGLLTACSGSISTSGNHPEQKGKSFLKPNPAIDKIQIAGCYELIDRIDILNYSGKQIYTASNQRLIDIHTLYPGFYLLRIVLMNGNIIMEKFIKQ